jgi:hypothetical protein
MPVTVEEFVKIRLSDGTEKEGKALANDIVAIEDADGELDYGKLLGISFVRTKIECDSGPACTQSTVDDEFHTQPKRIFFDESGGAPEQFVKEMAEVTVVSDYKGVKQVFCSWECSAAHFRRLGKSTNVIEFPSQKQVKDFGK